MNKKHPGVYLRGKTYWIKYSRNGRPFRESSNSEKESDAVRLLNLRRGDIARGVPVDSSARARHGGRVDGRRDQRLPRQRQTHSQRRGTALEISSTAGFWRTPGLVDHDSGRQ